MSLDRGTRLGPYEILEPIGAGGMGEVYKARDTRLDRTVAIKICAEQFSERFEREARAVSALNHPHICQVYDIGTNYLVMEHIEGVPLKGPLRLDQALKYAAQICDALDAAHRKGITHRDLKPANILVTPTAVKLLDFGLAKMERPVAIDDHTMTMARTGKGQILGTLQYMSPEQLQGQEADARSDIFSFGLVLYEILTGKRAFEGSSLASVIAAILERQVPSVAHVAPLALERTLRRCLEKDPENRWQSARDLKAELEWIAAGDFLSPRVVTRRALIPWVAGGIAGAAAGAGIATLASRSKDSAFSVGAIRFLLAPLEGAWRQSGAIRQALALSPLGGRVAIIAANERGPGIWVQRLDSLTWSPLAGTDGAYSLFWSPDGKFIGFWADGKIKKIPADGGATLAICDFPSPCASATWNRQGIIVTPQVAGGAPSSISVQSGAVTPLVSVRSLSWPKFLPDGKRILHLSRDPATGGAHANVADLSTGRETELMPTDTLVIFVPDRIGSGEGYLLFGRGAALLALRFDADRLRITGEPVPVAREVPFLKPSAWSEFDASTDGILIYSIGSQKAQLTWLDRNGRELGVLGDAQDYWGTFRLSPDGKRLAADVFDFGKGNIDVWAYDLSQATAERITFATGNFPLWSPDGTRVAFQSSLGGRGLRLRVKAVGDRGTGDVFEPRDANQPPNSIQLPTDWSSDGRWIFYQTSASGVNAEVWLASVADRKTIPLLQTRSDCEHATLSPNREHLAFSANDTGRHEIYVQRFQADNSPKLIGDRRRVSRNGGTFPRWRRDGKELFFLSPDHHIMAAQVKPETQIEIGPPIALFQVPTSFRAAATEVAAGYEVSIDGQKFLVPIRKVASSPLEVVVNWQAELRQ